MEEGGGGGGGGPVACPLVVRDFEVNAVLLLGNLDGLVPLAACLVHLVEEVVTAALDVEPLSILQQPLITVTE